MLRPNNRVQVRGDAAQPGPGRARAVNARTGKENDHRPQAEAGAWARPMLYTKSALRGRESACKAGDVSEAGLTPGWGRPPGGGYGNPLQYSYLENATDRGALWTTVHGVTQSQTCLKRLSSSSSSQY